MLSEPVVLLVAEDSEVDRMLLQEAFDELDFHVHLIFVGDGEELLAHLRRAAPGRGTPRRLPSLVLMDLNMPRMKGIDALRAMRADAELCVLPVIVLSTSNSTRQIALAYAVGANAYLTKPADFPDFVDLLQRFGNFWLFSAKLPTATPDP